MSCTVTFSEIEATVNIRFSDCAPAASVTFQGASDSSGAKPARCIRPASCRRMCKSPPLSATVLFTAPT